MQEVVSPQSSRSQKRVAAIIDDLYFMSIISSAARAREIEVMFVRPEQSIDGAVPLVLLDVESSRDWEAQIRPYVAEGGAVVAFGPHLNQEMRAKARAAGCRRVLAKSKFVHDVGTIMTEAVQATSGKGPGRGERTAQD